MAGEPETLHLSPDRQEIGAAIGRIPSGCAILTARHQGRASGVLVSWIQQVSFEPLSISVCLRRGRPILPLIEGSGRFVLNVFGDAPAAMFRHFGKGFTLEEDALKGLAVQDSEYGPLLTACIAHLACNVAQRITVGDHDLFVGEVASGACIDGAKPYIHVRGSGLGY